MTLGPIQRLPSGLLGFLQLKTRGAAPSELGDVVQPVVDMMPFWLLQDVRPALAVIPAIGGTGSNIITTFGPTTEHQYVHEYSILCPMGAGDGVDMVALTLIDPVATALHHILECRNFSPAVLGPNNSLVLTVRNFWRPAGTALGVLTYSNTAGSTFSGTAQVRVTQIFQ